MSNQNDYIHFEGGTFPKYIREFTSAPIDMLKLRPNHSYDFLFKNRDYLLEELLKENAGSLPEHLLVDFPCSLCGNNDAELKMVKDGFHIVECQVCTLVYVNPRLSQEAYESTYNSENYGHIIDKLSLESHSYRKERFGKERIELIESYLSKDASKRVLDIGSASGFFLEAANEAGWDSIGLELTQSAVEFSKARGIDVRQTTLDKSSFTPGSFSAITMFDVLEHIPEPLDTLRKIHALLEENGLVYIYVPNWNSASRLLMGKAAHFIWPTHHLTYFTPLTLSRALSSVGFKIEKIETQGLDVVDWLWQEKNINQNDTVWMEDKVEELQFLINCGGYGKNLRILARK
jgi:2-polyprenyl-3-methyl-5-hydroxy-6-metoxy-1,4-benzoquinol methylase